MRYSFIFASISAFLFSASPTIAGPATEKMSDCLVKKTTGQDRIDLVRWIVLAYSKHPDVSSFVSTDRAIDTGIQMSMGEMFNRLILVDCRNESLQAFEIDGEEAFENAFKVLGEVAALELLRENEVNESIMGFLEFVNLEEFDKMLR